MVREPARHGHFGHSLSGRGTRRAPYPLRERSSRSSLHAAPEDVSQGSARRFRQPLCQSTRCALDVGALADAGVLVAVTERNRLQSEFVPLLSADALAQRGKESQRPQDRGRFLFFVFTYASGLVELFLVECLAKEASMFEIVVWLVIALILWGLGVGLAALHAVIGAGLLALTAVFIVCVFKRAPDVGQLREDTASVFDVADIEHRCVIILWLVAWTAGVCQGFWTSL